MPSPFPGMDPYLEGPSYWRGVHAGLITFINQQLNTILPPGFGANMDERAYVAYNDRHIYPDVAVIEYDDSEKGVGTATLTRPAVVAPSILTVLADEMREPYIEIRAATPEREIVTVIEVLSPANKTPGAEGQGQYRAKQREVLESTAHLLEIDLLRKGAHTIAAPEWGMVSVGGPSDYRICLSRADNRRRYEIWRVNLPDPLPVVAVPLSEGYEDVPLDLKAVFDRMYDSGPYRRLMNYAAPPEIPLDKKAAAWAAGVLQMRP